MVLVDVRTVGVVLALVAVGCAPHESPAEKMAAQRELRDEPYPGPKTQGPCDPLEVLPEYAGKRRIEIELLAQDPSGNIVMATHPRPPDNVMSSTGLRLFFGPPEAVQERQLGSFGADEEGLFFNFWMDDGTGAVRVSRDECEDLATCQGIIKYDHGRARIIPVQRGVSGLKFVCRAWWKER